MTLRLDSLPGCPGRVRLARSRQVNAFASGRNLKQRLTDPDAIVVVFPPPACARIMQAAVELADRDGLVVVSSEAGSVDL